MKDTHVCYFMPTALSSLLRFEKDVPVPLEDILGKMLHYVEVNGLRNRNDKMTIVPNDALAAAIGGAPLRLVDLPTMLMARLQRA